MSIVFSLARPPWLYPASLNNVEVIRKIPITIIIFRENFQISPSARIYCYCVLNLRDRIEAKFSEKYLLAEKYFMPDPSYLGGRSVRVGGKVGGGESSGVAIRRVGGLLRGDLCVDGVEVLRQGAVHVEPPVTDQVLLVEHCP